MDSSKLTISIDGKNHELNNSVIYSIQKESVMNYGPPPKTPTIFYELGLNFGSSTTMAGHIGVLTGLNNRILLGGGSGLEFFNYDPMFPVYTDFRFNISKKSSLPYIAIKGGLTLPVETSGYEKYKIGTILEIGPAIKIFRPNDKYLYFASGFRHSYLKYERKDWGEVDVNIKEYFINRIYLKLGVAFF